jgi:hypothetical protein
MIPSSFPLLGHTIQVFVTPREDWEFGDDCVGIWLPHCHQIHIQGGVDDSLKMHTFFHEMCHAVLDMMNHKLGRNEVFVDTLAGLLHQALTGAQYPKPVQKRASKKRRAPSSHHT